jgi:hypothetical protein
MTEFASTTEQSQVLNELVRDIDPFSDVDALRLSTDASTIAVRKVITRVPVRKPGNQEFFRVHPDAQYRLDTAIVAIQEDREAYLVDPRLRVELADEVRAVRLYSWISRAGALCLWAVPLPGPDGRRNGWHDSAHAAAEVAMGEWTRIRADMSAGQYETSVAAAELPEPEWPDLPFKELLRLAFKDNYIASTEHPVVERLRGLR